MVPDIPGRFMELLMKYVYSLSFDLIQQRRFTSGFVTFDIINN